MSGGRINKFVSLFLSLILLFASFSGCNFQSKKSQGDSTGAISNGDGLGGAEGEGFSGAEGEGFSGIIAPIKSVYVFSNFDLPVGTLFTMEGSNIVEGIKVTVAGVNCVNVEVITVNKLKCFSTEPISNLSSNGTIVTTEIPGDDPHESKPPFYIDADFDGVPEKILNYESVCPEGTCKGEECLVERYVAWQDNQYAAFIFDECAVDNCPEEFNPSQSDADGDGVGNACDSDTGVGSSEEDEWQTQLELIMGKYDPPWDSDNDGVEDKDDEYPDFNQFLDEDGDGIYDFKQDNCPGIYNPSQSDLNKDGSSDACDFISDSDNDGYVDALDTCPSIANPEQNVIDLELDKDNDLILDNCGDTNIPPNAIVTKIISPKSGELAKGTILELSGENFIAGVTINLRTTIRKFISTCYWNYYSGNGICHESTTYGATSYLISDCTVTQVVNTTKIFCELKDTINLGDGTVYQQHSVLTKYAEGGNIYSKPVIITPDSDSDGFSDLSDNCPLVFNNQIDSDKDHTGDACDISPQGEDSDGDGIIDYQDNCRDLSNPEQVDVNHNKIGDLCDFDTDADGDGYYGAYSNRDNCPSISNDQTDTDEDGIGDLCDDTPNGVDADNDGHREGKDNCPSIYNPLQEDFDQDGIGDPCDSLSYELPSVTSIEVPSTTDLAKRSIITVHGDNFVTGMTVVFTVDYKSYNYYLGTPGQAGCRIKTLTATELTCELRQNVQILLPSVTVTNPGGGSVFDDSLELVVE